ncbi:MAG TPA: helix-turn-helix transcriptional regulator [Patescibacteria group bacterium]|nr:helix-turn-helix transcriptional regulator [Patescibacteria group bacterium]
MNPTLYFGFVGFVALQERLRRELRRRIGAGELTGTGLARKTGFTQAHISNFINRKRGLKLPALDRITKAVGLTIYDLLDPRELTRHLTLPAAIEDDFIDVPVIEPAAAMNPVIVRQQMRKVLKFRRSLLDRLRAPGPATRKNWTRFVAIEIDAGQAAQMWPEAGAGARAIVLVDRFYTSLAPYRPGERNIYLIQGESGILARYVERCEAGLVLQPRGPAFPATLLPAAALPEVIVGRVAQLSLQT